MTGGWEELRQALTFYEVGDIEGKIVLIERYSALLFDKRDWAGLTSKSISEKFEDVVVDSLVVLEVAACRASKVAEIGSGGGLLGVVLAIVCPEWRVTMIESAGRKVAFLTEVVGALGLTNAEVVKARAESVAGKREFDLCVSRAAGRLAEIAPVALAMLSRGGKYLALKASDVGHEIEEAKGMIERARGRFVGVVEPRCVGCGQRPARASLVVIEKL